MQNQTSSPLGLSWNTVREAMLRTKGRFQSDNLTILAAGVAFYAVLSLAPALLATVSLWGLVADPSSVAELVSSLGTAVPEQAREILQGQLDAIVSSAASALGGASLVGILLALWSANSATKALFTGINVAYEETEERGFLTLNAVSLGTTLAGVLLALVAVALVAGMPAFISALNLGDVASTLAQLCRWPVLFLLMAGFIGLAYRTGPSRRPASLRWRMPGALAATTLWLLASGGFSLYVRYFGSYGETYGSLGGVVVLMLWLWISALVVLVGAELNAELERQTVYDTIIGRERPMGNRGATVADTRPEPAAG